jgi:hypothetical protein
LLKAGFLDGLAGLYISYFAAYNVFLKYFLLRRMKKSRVPSDQNRHSTTITPPNTSNL